MITKPKKAKRPAKRSSWQEKLDQSDGLPKVAPIGETMRKQWGEGTFVVPTPREVDGIMKAVPAGKLITIQEIRAVVAKRHGATIGCPLTTGIFAWIAAHAAQEALDANRDDDATPYWRTLKAGGFLNEKYPGGISAQKEKLEAEGHSVVERGSRFAVVNYESAIAVPKTGRRSSARSSSDRTIPGHAGDLVLASTSAYRCALLERLRVPFRSMAPACDESALKADLSNPTVLAEKLAHAKAASLAGEGPNATIIGCDQLLSLEGQVFGKPGTVAAALDQLAALAGRSHELITAMVVISGSRSFRHMDVTRLWMRPLSRAALERYVVAERPLDCAGSYKIESQGIALFERIESADHTAITGLPLIALVSILRELGFEIP